MPFQTNFTQGSQATKPSHKWYRRIKGNWKKVFISTNWKLLFSTIDLIVGKNWITTTILWYWLTSNDITDFILLWYFFFAISVGRFWSGTSQVSSYQNLFKRSSNLMVSTARCPSRFYWIFHANRYVGCGLHFLWDGLRTSSFSRFHCWGRTSPNF